MSHPDRNDDHLELDLNFERLPDEEVGFVESEPEVPTRRFNERVHALIQDEKLLNDEPTTSQNHFDILRTAFRKGDIESLKDALQMVNVLFLGEWIEESDLEFDMMQVEQWFKTDDVDDRLDLSLSDASSVQITMVGSKRKDGEPSFHFTNQVIQEQFEAVQHSDSIPGE